MFKVMTWNVQNLFRAGHPGGPNTTAAYEQKVSGLAKAINDQAPDAVALLHPGEKITLDLLESGGPVESDGDIVQAKLFVIR